MLAGQHVADGKPFCFRGIFSSSCGVADKSRAEAILNAAQSQHNESEADSHDSEPRVSLDFIDFLVTTIVYYLERESF